MPLPSSLLLFMLVLGSIPICSTHWAPRTLRPNLLGPPPSLIRRGTGQTLAAGTSGIDYNNSSSRYSSGTGTLPIVSIPTNDSSTQQQYTSDTLSTHYSRYEEVCGTRTRNIISYGDEEPNAFFNFPDFCLLWDDTCSGNESFAKQEYSKYGWFVRLDPCFGDPSCQCMLNGKAIPEASASGYANMMSYARSPACAAAFGNYSGSCCGLQECFFDPTYVEVYYWPVEDADTSCLSVIGDSVKPWDYGATLTTTTEAGDWHGRPGNWNPVGTYWGCTSGLQVITTAVMTSVNGFTFKSSRYNPWGQDNPCVATSSTSEIPVLNNTVVSEYKMRARSLLRSADPGGNITVPVTEVTLDGYTFTSPSVYVNFIGLQAHDDCGPLRTASSMYTTMIAFEADELSTVVGGGDIYFPMQKLAPFNVADLPCPPQSIMEANWYKPAPGEPYVPRLAFPSRIKSIDHLWASCEPGIFFTAYDPPRTLVPVSAVSPDITVDLPGATPSPHPVGNDPITSPTAAPESTPELSQPQQTATRVTSPGDSNGDPSFPKPIATQGSSSNHGSGSNADPVDVPSDAEVATPSPNGGDPQNGIDHGGLSHTVPVDAGNHSPVLITTVAGHAATLLPPIVAIGSTTLTYGATPITISGTKISFGSTALIVGSNTLPLPQSQQVVTSVAGHEATFVPNAVAIGGTTLTPGGAPVTLSGTTISLESSAIVVAPMSLPLTHVGDVISNIAGSPATIMAANAVEIGGVSLRPGDPPLTISGMVLSISSTFLMMGAQTIPFAQLPSVTIPAGRATITAIAGVGGTPISLLPNGDLVIGATTLSRGGAAANLDGMPISLAPDGNFVLDGTTIRPGGAGVTLEGTPVSVAADGNLVIDGTTMTPGGAAVSFGETPTFFAADGNVVVGGMTLRPGGAGATIHGTIFSVAADGGLVFDGTTLEPKTRNSDAYLGAITTFQALGGDLILDGVTLRPGAAGITMGGVPVSMAPDGELVIDDTTLKPAGTGITVGGTVISVAADGHLVIHGTTLQPGGAGMSTMFTSNGDLIVDGSTLRPGGAGVTVGATPVSVAPGGALVINGTTLKPGDGFAIGGTTVTVVANGQLVVVNPTDSTGGLGSLIMGGFGAGPTGYSVANSSSSLSLVMFEGAATSVACTWNHRAVGMIAMLVTMLMS